MIKFNITANERVFQREGRIIKIGGQPFGLHKETKMYFWNTFGSWVVTHLPSGFVVAYETKAKDAIALATKRAPLIESKMAYIMKTLKRHDIKYPVNSIHR